MEEDKSIKIKKIIRKSLRFISYSIILVLMIIAAFLVFYVVSNFIYKDSGEHPPFGLYTVVSPSMEDTINVYDVILVKKVDPSKLKKDDIITFYSTNPFFGSTPITHRIVEIMNENGTYSFIVKGDANKIPDEEVVISENILGRVYLIFPGLGKVQFFLASKGGILLAILIPAIAIIGYDIYKIGKGLLLKKRMKELDELEKK